MLKPHLIEVLYWQSFRYLKQTPLLNRCQKLTGIFHNLEGRCKSDGCFSLTHIFSHKQDSNILKLMYSHERIKVFNHIDLLLYVNLRRKDHNIITFYYFNYYYRIISLVIHKYQYLYKIKQSYIIYIYLVHFIIILSP